MQSSQTLEGVLGRQRAAQLAEGPPSAEVRLDRLDRCLALLRENQDVLERTVSADFGNRSLHASGLTDIMTPIAALAHARKHLRKWMRAERRPVEPRILGFLSAKAEIHFQPKGVVGIVSPWNFPIGLIFSPLAGALAAGNRAMVKPSEHTPKTAALLQDLIAKRFAQDEVAVFTGDADVGMAFTALPFDHLVFTGAGSIARHVMRAAAENLVPVTLELGGKSPVVIGSDVDMPVAAARIMSGKILNAGQICLAPDYALVREGAEDAFVTEAVRAASEMLPHIRDNPDYTAIISERHHARLNGYVDEARSKGARIVEINTAGENLAEQEHRRMAPTVIVGATRDMAVMKEEIFGPILPVMRYETLDQAINLVNGGDRPLALSYFGRSELEFVRLRERTTSGGMCVNDVIMHCAQEDLPFGGVGPSGMGVYHGRDGFLEFSHRKSIYRQIKRDLGPLKTFPPPYDERVRKLMRPIIGG